MDAAAHWDQVYAGRAETALTWFESDPGASIRLIHPHLRPGDPIVDIGGGASRFADGCLAAGLGPVTVLDLSAKAIDVARARLGERAASVRWVVCDVLDWRPDRAYALWRDRAAFHFLTEAADQARYVSVLDAALAPGGWAVIATFAEDGPETCSGLPVRRYAPDALRARLDALAPGQFRPIEALRHRHVTPSGATQSFQTSVFRKREEAPS